MNENHQRIEEFKSEIAGMQISTPSSENEKWLLIGGVSLCALGLIFIFAGWWGASGTGNIANQFPYLISGGVLGLGFLVAGGVLFVRYSMSRYLRYWLVRMIYEQQAQTDRVVDSITSLENVLRSAAKPRTPAP